MNGVTITQNKEYIFIKIPKKQVVKGKIETVKKELSEDEVLKMFAKGKQEFKQKELKPVQDLAQLLSM